MIVANNLMALTVGNQLGRNAKKASGFAKQLSSGEKISSAGDGASDYSISEKMKVSIRALGQCSDNVKNGSNLLNSASAAVDQQVDIMKKVRELAMRASDDTYNDKDRAILQKEVSQMLDQSEDIAQSTNFNGIALLNRAEFSSKDRWFDDTVPYHDNPNHEQVLQFPSNAILTTSADGNVSGKGVPFGTYTTITASPSNAFDASAVVPGADLTALPAVNSVVWDKSLGAYGRVTLDALDHALYVQSGAGKTLIDVQGIANAVYAVPASTNVAAAVYAAVASPAVGSSVAASATPIFDGNTPPVVTAATTYPVKNAPGSGLLSYVNSSSSTSIMEVDFSGVFPLTNGSQDLDRIGFSTACAGCGQFVSVQFDASTDASEKYEGKTGSPPPLCYVIGVKSVTNSTSLMEAVFNGITAKSGIAGGGTLPSAVDAQTKITSAHDIRLDYYAATGKLTIAKDGPAFVFNNGIIGDMIEVSYFKPKQNLSLQTSDESSQYTNVLVPNTTLSAIFPDASSNCDIAPKDSDYPSQWPNGYETLTTPQKCAKWRDEAWPYPEKGAALRTDTCVSTRANAAKFLDRVDQSLKYLISSNTTLGAQVSRLQYTGANLDTSVLNQTASESSMRDTNVAEAMLGFARENVLTQSAQAMLAQANQAPSKVLSLLQ